MSEWKLVAVEGFDTRLRKISKRYPEETKAVLANLDRYKKALDELGVPQRVRAGFIHDEKKGVVAIDQSGVAGTQLRLYLVPKSREIRLITIGDKGSQQADIRHAHDYVKKQRGKR
jgi:hypothetical protein